MNKDSDHAQEEADHQYTLCKEALSMGRERASYYALHPVQGTRSDHLPAGRTSPRTRGRLHHLVSWHPSSMESHRR